MKDIHQDDVDDNKDIKQSPNSQQFYQIPDTSNPDVLSTT